MDKYLLEKTIKRLEDKLIVDRDVMEADDVEDLMNNIAELKKLVPNDESKLYDVTVKYIQTYQIFIGAKCAKEAEDRARELYRSGQLLLKSSILDATAK